MRYFEVMYDYGKIPTRATSGSAGYDFYIPEKVILEPGETKMIKTGVRAYMEKNEVLLLYVRSSVGIKKKLVLANGTGVIDSDYYNNASNGGEIGICLRNNSFDHVTIEAGERIAQGIFINYLTVDNDNTNTDRSGGFGSTS